jgi:lysine 2,3-aminomutase
MDPVLGTSHLRTPLARGEQIMTELQGQLSGIALPKFIVDTPGGFGKVPAGPSYVVERHEGRTTFRSPRGNLVDYFDP